MKPAALTALAILALYTVYDIRTREIPESLAYAGLLAVAAAKAVEYIVYGEFFSGMLPPKLYITVDLIVLVSSMVIAFMGLWGWADVVSLAVTAIALPGAPPGGVFPAILLVLVYYIAANLTVLLYNMLSNIARYRRELRRLPPRVRLVYLMLAQPRSVRRLLAKPGWWYPLSLCGKYRYTFNIYEDPGDVAKKLREALDKGCIGVDDTVWVTYGLPGIPLITAAYIATLVLGDKPLLTLLGLT